MSNSERSVFFNNLLCGGSLRQNSIAFTIALLHAGLLVVNSHSCNVEIFEEVFKHLRLIYVELLCLGVFVRVGLTWIWCFFLEINEVIGLNAIMFIIVRYEQESLVLIVTESDDLLAHFAIASAYV